MSDDNTLDASTPAGGEGFVELPEGAENATDPTPGQDAANEGDASAPQTDSSVNHDVWRRPDTEAPVRTSEAVGAIHDDTPPVVHPMTRASARRTAPSEEATSGAIAARQSRAVVEEPADQAPSIPTEQMAAVIGARAALDRGAEPGASLDHEPDILAADTHPGRPVWLRLLPWLAGILALALVVGGIVFATTRKSTVIVTPTPTPSATTPDPVTEANLLTAAEMEAVAPKAGWKEGTTVTRLTNSTPRITCLANTTGQPNPILTRQRTMTTASAQKLGAMHQIDAYANAAEASKVYELRAAQLAMCNDVPTWLVGADKVTGLGDEAQSVTIAYQDAVAQYHTVVLSRTGTVVQALDTTQLTAAVPTKQVLPAFARAVTRQCATSGGACAKAPDTTPTGPARTETPGWLVPSDLQRVTAGAGLWTSTESQPVTSKGSQCENMTLASEAGPIRREQRTYLMTQDPAAPQTFGIDEVVMTFASPSDALAFSRKLQGNLMTCATRMAKSVVSDAQTATAVIDGQTVITSTQMVTLPLLQGAQTTRFSTAVIVNGGMVVYLVNNPGPSYDLGKDKFLQIAQRAGQRSSQSK